ncbi:MAG: hypothetical protein ABI577_03270 [bacterium]
MLAPRSKGPLEAARSIVGVSLPCIDLTDWTDHQLRLVYFDFTVRGEGPADLIEAVILEWTRRDVLSEQVAGFWLDALFWRESGNVLPGWTASEAAGRRFGDDVDYWRFLAWRTAA